MEIIKKINLYKTFLIISLISLCFTGYYIQDSIRYAADSISGKPQNLSGKKDTVIVYKSEYLSNKQSLFYLECYFDKQVINSKVNSSYEYNTDYPEEIWNGYLNLVRSSNNVPYFIWTQTPIDTVTRPNKIKGYFHSLSNKWQINGEEYADVLIPIFSKQFNEDITIHK